MFFFFFQGYGRHRDLHSFPTRRSSDLDAGWRPGGVARLRRQPRSVGAGPPRLSRDRKSTRLNSSHITISYAVFCLKKKTLLILITVSAIFSANIIPLMGCLRPRRNVAT